MLTNEYIIKSGSHSNMQLKNRDLHGIHQEVYSVQVL